MLGAKASPEGRGSCNGDGGRGADRDGPAKGSDDDDKSFTVPATLISAVAQTRTEQGMEEHDMERQEPVCATRTPYNVPLESKKNRPVLCELPRMDHRQRVPDEGGGRGLADPAHAELSAAAVVLPSIMRPWRAAVGRGRTTPF